MTRLTISEPWNLLQIRHLGKHSEKLQPGQGSPDFHGDFHLFSAHTGFTLYAQRKAKGAHTAREDTWPLGCLLLVHSLFAVCILIAHLPAFTPFVATDLRW